MTDGSALFRPGRNIAMKLPPDQFEATLSFYRDTLGLNVKPSHSGSWIVDFGAIRLWLDRVATVSQAELWLEVETESAERAADALAAAGVVRCDEIEPLPIDSQILKLHD
jgi:hypothetical protein